MEESLADLTNHIYQDRQYCLPVILAPKTLFDSLFSFFDTTNSRELFLTMRLPQLILLVGISLFHTHECYAQNDARSTIPIDQDPNLLVVDLASKPTIKSLTINWAIAEMQTIMTSPHTSFRSTPLTSAEIGLGPDADGSWNLVLYLHELIDGNPYISVYLERQHSTKGKVHVTLSLQAKLDNGTVINSVGPETTIFPDGEADNTNYGWANFLKESLLDRSPSSSLHIQAQVSLTGPVTTTRLTQRQQVESDSKPFAKNPISQGTVKETSRTTDSLLTGTPASTEKRRE